MSERKRRSNKKEIAKKTNKNKIIIATIAILLIGISIGLYVNNVHGNNTSGNQAQNSAQAPSTSNMTVESNNNSESNSDNKETKTETKTETQEQPKSLEPEKPVDSKENSLVPTTAPQVTSDTVNKIELLMTTEQVKAIIGEKAFDEATKAGTSVSGVTVGVANTTGGIVLLFEDGAVSSITRTYALPEKTEADFQKINKGMTMQQVRSQLGAPITENGKRGTIVFNYKLNQNGAQVDKIIAFDENNKVLVVS